MFIGGDDRRERETATSGSGGAWREYTQELGGGARVGVHTGFFSVELAGTWLHPQERPEQVYLGGHTRKGELSLLALTGAEGRLGWKGQRAEVRAGVDVGVGNGVHLSRTCASYDPVLFQAACTSFPYRPRTHLLASLGPRLAVGPVWLVARAEPHLAYGNLPSYERGGVNPRQRLYGWVDLRLGLRVQL